MNFSSLKSEKEKGQGLVEYALILVLVAVVVIAVLKVLGPKVGVVFAQIEAPVATAGNSAAQAFIGTCQQTQGQFAVYYTSGGFTDGLEQNGTLTLHNYYSGTGFYVDCVSWGN